MTSARKGFVQIIIVAMIALALGAVAMFGYQKYFKKSPVNIVGRSVTVPTASPVVSIKPDETVYADPGGAGWKTYANKDLGFEINHPENWKPGYHESKVTGTGNSTPPSYRGVFISSASPDTSGGLGGVGGFAVDLFDNSEKLTSGQFFTKWDYYCCEPDVGPPILPDAIKNAVEVSVNGIPGKKLTLPVDVTGFYSEWVIVNKNDKIFRITILCRPNYSKNYQTYCDKNFDQILSTFKFTE